MATAPSLFLQRVSAMVRRPPVTCVPSLPAVEVARLMTRERVGSVIVIDDGRAVGIVTDRDLRRKVVAEGRDAVATRAATIMSAPVVAVAPDAFAITALLEMTRREIHHLAVVDGGRLVGVVSSHDFLMIETAHPVILTGEIARAASVDRLRELATRTIPLTRRLVEAGGTAYDIGQLVAELNDRLVVAALALTTAAATARGDEASDTAWCWLAFGSEARREQTLRTDQDNGLVYQDVEPERQAAVAGYFARFAAEAVRHLVAIGFPPCPGDAMASNPRWCQPLHVWRSYFRGWMETPEPEPLLAAQIYFDVRPLAGALALGESLHELVVREAPAHRLFLGLIARDLVARRPPLTIFGNVAVERNGARRGTVDVKAGAALPLASAARLHALELGIDATNTVDRIRAAGARGLYREDETREITDAFQHVTRLRLVHQLDRLAHGASPDNAIRPDRLSRADALLLRDALRTVQRVQSGVRERYKTELMG
jgi:CBS domain-containing protein